MKALCFAAAIVLLAVSAFAGQVRRYGSFARFDDQYTGSKVIEVEGGKHRRRTLRWQCLGQGASQAKPSQIRVGFEFGEFELAASGKPDEMPMGEWLPSRRLGPPKTYAVQVKSDNAAPVRMVGDSHAGKTTVWIRDVVGFTKVAQKSSTISLRLALSNYDFETFKLQGLSKALDALPCYF
jgi:hypothetical protein